MSEKGRYHRCKRPIEVEAVFGQLKSNNKFNRFTHRGKEKVEMEFLLMAVGHNFRKLVSNKATTAKKEAKSNENVVKTPQNATFSFFYLAQSA